MPLQVTNQRYSQVIDDDQSLTEAEAAAGWHFCAEFDGLLVGPGMGELRCCRCLPSSHPVYATVPPPEDVVSADLP